MAPPVTCTGLEHGPPAPASACFRVDVGTPARVGTGIAATVCGRLSGSRPGPAPPPPPTWRNAQDATPESTTGPGTLRCPETSQGWVLAEMTNPCDHARAQRATPLRRVRLGSVARNGRPRWEDGVTQPSRAASHWLIGSGPWRHTSRATTPGWANNRHAVALAHAHYASDVAGPATAPTSRSCSPSGRSSSTATRGSRAARAGCKLLHASTFLDPAGADGRLGVPVHGTRHAKRMIADGRASVSHLLR